MALTVPSSPAPAPKIDTEAILPVSGISLPVAWKDLGKQMIMAGVIDNVKMETLYNQRGGMSEMMKKMLKENNNEKLPVTRKIPASF